MGGLPSAESAELKAALKEVAAELRALPEKMAEVYVRKDTHQRDLELVDQRHEATQKQVDQHGRYFQWVVTTVLAALIVGGIGLLFATQHGGFH
jgi:hypothetical protein